jgi:hypothetical protein
MTESALRQAREALHLAEGALLQCTPCAAPACAQEQREWLDDAMAACHKAAGAIDAALTAPAAPSEPVAWRPCLIERLNDEADRCGNDGADDIAHLLWEAANALAAPPPPAAPAVAPGFALVPKHMTQAMRDVTDTEDWTWEDLLAAAEAITEAEYDEIAAVPAVAVEPQPHPPLPEAAGWANKSSLITARLGRERYGNAGACEMHTLREGGPTDYHSEAMFTAEQMYAFVDADRATRAAPAQPAAAPALCSDCPPIGYPTDKTRCDECPRREPDRAWFQRVAVLARVWPESDEANVPAAIVGAIQKYRRAMLTAPAQPAPQRQEDAVEPTQAQAALALLKRIRYHAERHSLPREWLTEADEVLGTWGDTAPAQPAPQPRKD